MKAALPEEFLCAWRERDALAALATTDPAGQPNVIWVLCLHLIEASAHLIIADNAMEKTKTNLVVGSRGALVCLAQPRRAYQVKGALSYHDQGPVFEAMKNGWLDKRFPGNGAVELVIEEIFVGAERVWQRI